MGSMPTVNANGTFTVNQNPFGGTQQGILDAIKNQPLPFDASAIYKQMMDLYAQQMAKSQGYYDSMLGMQGQLNDLLGQDPAAAYHEQLMAMYAPVRHTNTMARYEGY